MPTYRCVTCQQEACYKGSLPELYPFCSHRCRWVDLGLWLREAFAIDATVQPEDIHPEQAPQPELNDERHR
jgi:endogenous inhibitor of DNA gyrase (YacG/DUF329 family)